MNTTLAKANVDTIINTVISDWIEGLKAYPINEILSSSIMSILTDAGAYSGSLTSDWQTTMENLKADIDDYVNQTAEHQALLDTIEAWSA